MTQLSKELFLTSIVESERCYLITFQYQGTRAYGVFQKGSSVANSLDSDMPDETFAEFDSILYSLRESVQVTIQQYENGKNQR